MNYEIKLAKKVLNGYLIEKDEILSLYEKSNSENIFEAADLIRKKRFGDFVELCSIINGLSGKCSENCKFCAQSSHYNTQVKVTQFIDSNEILSQAEYNYTKGVHRFSIVTSGKKLSDIDFEKTVSAYKLLTDKCSIKLCASHGLLTQEQFDKLSEAGVKRYHNNLETSRNYFPNICTTHTYQDKIDTINRAKKAGMQICSGGIFGLGESVTDRIDMAFELREINPVSVPLNFLNPIKGTPMENNKPISNEEAMKITAVYKFILPNADIRLAGGRILLEENGKYLFNCGANAAITGDMLTTSGNGIEEDKDMLKSISRYTAVL